MTTLSDLPDFPFVEEDAKTWQRLEPITFMGERVPPWPADAEIPPWPRSQADISTLDLRVRPAAPSAGGAAPAPRIAGTGEVAGDARGHGVGGQR